MKSIRDIDESKIKIEDKSWDDDLIQLLAAKQNLVFGECCKYWQPMIERGRKLRDYFEGNILSPEAIAQYTKDGKVIIQPPIAKSPIRSLVGHAMLSRKSGQVVTERGAEADSEGNEKELETINIVLKDMETKTKEKYNITESLTHALVTCYYNVLLFDKVRPSRNGDGARYKMSALPWGSCVFGPMTAREPDGSDIKELFYFDYRTIADLLDNYPDMEKQILSHIADDGTVDNKLISSVDQWGGDWNADERDEMLNVLQAAHDARTANMLQVVQRLYPVKKKEEVWINIFDDSGETFEMRPPDWDDERWAQWQAENPNYVGPYEREVIVLWQTIFTTSGLVLSNKAHWFQENGLLPASFWAGAVDFGNVTGPMEDMAENILANCVAEIEYMHDLRTGSGKLGVVKEGAVTNLENLHEEASSSFGIVTVSKDFNGFISDAYQEHSRQPNTNWKVYAEQNKAGMLENTRINPAMMGQHAERQSLVAKEHEVSQALTVHARYIDNFNRCWDRHQSLKLKLIAYLYTEWETIEVMDEESGEPMMAEVNAPAEYDMEGNVTSVINDLTAHRYRWRVSPVDDSPTAKQRDTQDAVAIINGMAGPLQSADPSGGALAMALMSCDNPMLKRMGRQMLERSEQAAQAAGAAEQQAMSVDQAVKLIKAKAEALRAQKLGTMINFRAEDLENYPGLNELWISLQGMFDQNADREVQEAMQMVSPQQPQEPIQGVV